MYSSAKVANAMQKSKTSRFSTVNILFAAKPGAQPALRLRGVLGDLTVKFVNSSVEVLAGLAGVFLAAYPGLVPFLLSFGAQRVVLCLSFGTVFLSFVLCFTAVFLSLALCLLRVGPEVCLSLLCLSTGTIRLLWVSICSVDDVKERRRCHAVTYVILCSCSDSLVPLLNGLLGLLVLAREVTTNLPCSIGSVVCKRQLCMSMICRGKTYARASSRRASGHLQRCRGSRYPHRRQRDHRMLQTCVRPFLMYESV